MRRAAGSLFERIYATSPLPSRGLSYSAANAECSVCTVALPCPAILGRSIRALRRGKGQLFAFPFCLLLLGSFISAVFRWFPGAGARRVLPREAIPSGPSHERKICRNDAAIAASLGLASR